MTKAADVYLLCDPWQIIEDGWSRKRNLVSESLFSLSNEFMGVRGYFDEGTKAETMRGSYFNGVYEEVDLSRSYKGIVNKMHFMINTVDFLHTEIRAGAEKLDMSISDIRNFRRVLDMRLGTLERSFDWHLCTGPVVHMEFIRFLNMEDAGRAYQKIRFSVTRGDARIEIIIANSFETTHGWEKKNYWDMEFREWNEHAAAVQARTIRTGQQIFSGFTWKAGPVAQWEKYEQEKIAGYKFVLPMKNGDDGWIEKCVFNYLVRERKIITETMWQLSWQELLDGPDFANALEQQKHYWADFWKNADIRIEGDPLNQQGIRYCIFQMHQTYHGYSPSNNIGAKGLTGEAYNGHAFWDTETYCLPFYLFSNPQAARNLLEFRYATLAKAKDRAKQLDCRGACYPLATLNGEEGCNLWQHASLQFQPSTGVAYGIEHYDKVCHDTEFLYGHGAEMLVEICRFLESRGSWNNDNSGFGFYAVMGPDEFHMMVNHNCYTNFMAKKTFEYTENTLKNMEAQAPEQFAQLCRKTGLTAEERETYKYCAEKMIILYDEQTRLYEQHDGYYSLPHIEISQIPVTDFPLYNNWSYDRIYRTSMIKQPDVLMFMFLYSQDFSEDAKRANYDFYEPNTIHESSLSPSIHSIFACELGKSADAFRFFGFATRMDLDNYNRNTAEGLHTTSIAAAWMNIVYGFGGLRSDGDILALSPVLPQQWSEYEFGILYRKAHIRVKVSADEVNLFTNDEIIEPIPLLIYGIRYMFDASGLKIPAQCK